jgi:hypothetical protein
MSTDASTDPVAAKLAEIRHDWDHSDGRPMRHIPALLGAVEAVLALHVRQAAPVRIHNLCPEHASLSALRDKRVRIEVETCTACTITQQFVCQHCSCPNEEWPCLTFRVLSAEMLGKDGADGT